MNEQYFAYKVRQHLNRGLQDLRAEPLERLAAARHAALARQKQAAANPILATAGNFFTFSLGNLRVNQILAALALLACVLYSTYWVADQNVQELEIIDSAILSDELPIGAFTDKGFAAWLNSTPSPQ